VRPVGFQPPCAEVNPPQKPGLDAGRWGAMEGGAALFAARCFQPEGGSHRVSGGQPLPGRSWRAGVEVAGRRRHGRQTPPRIDALWIAARVGCQTALHRRRSAAASTPLSGWCRASEARIEGGKAFNVIADHVRLPSNRFRCLRQPPVHAQLAGPWIEDTRPGICRGLTGGTRVRYPAALHHPFTTTLLALRGPGGVCVHGR